MGVACFRSEEDAVAVTVRGHVFDSDVQGVAVVTLKPEGVGSYGKAAGGQGEQEW